ncbi:MAG: hypothetical protein BYD32DRAFT_417483 [Podila humilis]|nr:MAG: hypothetical protein BYD32DRAFT_417483 [Podila humilis]
MIGRADIEELKSNIAMNAWLPRAGYQSRDTFNRLNFYSSILPCSFGLPREKGGGAKRRGCMYSA